VGVQVSMLSSFLNEAHLATSTRTKLIERLGLIERKTDPTLLERLQQTYADAVAEEDRRSSDRRRKSTRQSVSGRGRRGTRGAAGKGDDEMGGRAARWPDRGLHELALEQQQPLMNGDEQQGMDMTFYVVGMLVLLGVVEWEVKHGPRLRGPGGALREARLTRRGRMLARAHAHRTRDL
jgi:hypothetical protein